MIRSLLGWQLALSEIRKYQRIGVLYEVTCKLPLPCSGLKDRDCYYYLMNLFDTPKITALLPP